MTVGSIGVLRVEVSSEGGAKASENEWTSDGRSMGVLRVVMSLEGSAKVSGRSRPRTVGA